MFEGPIEIRRTSDLGIISTFNYHRREIRCICELEDGSFVSGSDDGETVIWDESRHILQFLTCGYSEAVYRVMELDSDIIVASSFDNTVKVWKVSTGQLLHTLTQHSELVHTLVRLSGDKFVTGSEDNTIRVWSGTKGECIETISPDDDFSSMARVGDSLVTASEYFMEVRRLKYDFIAFSVVFKIIDVTLRTRLVELCCAMIATNKELYMVDDLEQILPEELYSICFGPRT